MRRCPGNELVRVGEKECVINRQVIISTILRGVGVYGVNGRNKSAPVEGPTTGAAGPEALYGLLYIAGRRVVGGSAIAGWFYRMPVLVGFVPSDPSANAYARARARTHTRRRCSTSLNRPKCDDLPKREQLR